MWSLPGCLIVAVAVLLPWLTRWPATTPKLADAIRETPIFVADVGLLLMLAAWILGRDAWLGAFVAWMALSVLWHPQISAYETGLLCALGAMALVLLRRLTPGQVRWTVRGLLIGGGLEVAYSVVNALGYDLFWQGGAVTPPPHAMGTLGNSNYLAAYLAMTVALVPLTWLPVWGLGLVMTKSLMGMLAATVALLVRFRAHWIPVACTGTVGALLIMGLRDNWPDTVAARWEMWRLALHDLSLWTLWVGHGPGAWLERIPDVQMRVGFYPGGIFAWAHSDWLQLLYEGGLIGCALLIGWLVSHRGMWMGPFGGCLAALAVNALGNFPFHVGVTALTAVVLIGMALNQEDTHAALSG